MVIEGKPDVVVWIIAVIQGMASEASYLNWETKKKTSRLAVRRAKLDFVKAEDFMAQTWYDTVTLTIFLFSKMSQSFLNVSDWAWICSAAFRELVKSKLRVLVSLGKQVW